MTIKKELLRLTMPVFIDMALVVMVGAIDTVMLSRYSDDAVAAVGLDNQLLNLVFLVFQFISMGAAIVCAQYIGAGLRKRLVQVVGIALSISTLLGLLASCAMFFWAGPIVHFMGLRDSLLPDGVIYMKITGSLCFFQAISLLLAASLRSADKVVPPMVVTFIVNVLNIIGNYALIFGHFGCPAMGVEGAAWATAGSRAVAAIILLVIHTKIHIPSFPLRYFRPFPWKELRNLVRIGVPAMSEELSYCLSMVVITYFINQISTEALVTRTYCFTAMTFVIIFSQSIVNGGAIMVGHYVGQLRYRAAYILGNFVVRSAMTATLIMATLLALIGNPLLKFLTENQQIIEMGTWIFVIDWVLNIGRVRNIFACGTLRAAGDAVYPVIIGVTFQWSIAVGLAYVVGIPLGFGLIGMWVAFTLDENLRGIILMRRWHSLRWRGKSFTV